ncbi:MAG TPA: hypothetical protein VJB57_13725 [Dehalococcoidia bacterium]|nr:hypothetical protein [Dehalococcoidia bacterium]
MTSSGSSSDPLQGVRLKLARAQEHLDALKAEVQTFLDSDPVHAYRDKEPKDGFYIYGIHWGKKPDIRLGLLIGDWATNLRATLDHLSWQLALLTTDKPSIESTFPIFEKENVGRFNQRVKQWPDAAKAIAERMQPFKADGGRKPNEHMLWLINHLSNTDKHQVIRVAPGQIRVPGLRPGQLMIIDSFNDDHIELHVAVSLDPKTNLEPFLRARVVIAMPEIADGAILDMGVLDRAQDFVRDYAIPAFASFFP